jgi:FtsH-binding integral membrane protein
LFRYLGVVGLLFLGAYFLGDWLAKWYIKRKTASDKVMSFFAWTNIITWLLPPLGVFTASLAYGFSKKSDLSSTKKYRNLAIIGVILSLINASIGILQNLG